MRKDQYLNWCAEEGIHPKWCYGTGGGGTTVEKSDPWEGVQPYLKSGYEIASNLYGKYSPDYYPGTTIAPTDPLIKESRKGIEQYARGQMTDDITGMRGAYGSLLGAADVTRNPYLSQAVSGAMRPITEQLTEQVLPNIRSGAIQTGQYGGSRQGLAEGTAIGKAAQAMADTSANMYSNAYQQGLGTVQNALGMAPSMLQLSQMPYTTLGQLGQEYQTEQQKKIDDAIQAWNYEQNLPYTQLSDYMQILQGAAPYATRTSSQSGGGSDLMGGLGAAASIAAAFI